jgi:hypothetical protein
LKKKKGRSEGKEVSPNGGVDSVCQHSGVTVLCGDFHVCDAGSGHTPTRRTSREFHHAKLVLGNCGACSAAHSLLACQTQRIRQGAAN